MLLNQDLDLMTSLSLRLYRIQGYNAELIPIFRPVDPDTVEQIPETAAVIQVIDCVGKV